ncbi:homeobox and leucine zipper encoding a [Brachyhypopomus gauderio]|uniref:homeobox and leucine zipper encoding a n=1 Tax=Brachyhypopomus gauderio TaxID=698409 RepID=UPI004041B570
MDVPSEHDMKVTSPGGSLSKKEGKFSNPRQLKSPNHVNANGKAPTSPSNHKVKMTNGSTRGSGSMSFSTNNNSVVCLPLVSEGLKLVWTQSDQTKELDTIPELVQAFNVFPYPTSQEVSTLANVCALPLDKVKVWFMVQRIKYGISWASEDIEETRCKLAGPEPARGIVYEESKKRKRSGWDEHEEVEEKVHMEDSVHPASHKRHKNESPDFKLSPSTNSLSPHSPSQNSNYYSHSVDSPATPPSTASPSPLKSSSGSQQKHKRYKKSKAQLTALRKSFLQENWPAETELRRLQEETGLSRNEIRKWFSDSRYQLRNGRGMPGLVSPAAEEEKNNSNFQPLSEGEQLQPLSLVIEKQQTGTPAKAVARSKKVQKRGSSNSQFFQIFLSNTLEAFGEGEIDESDTNTGCEESCEEDGKSHNTNAEVGSKHDSKSHDSLTLSEPSVSISSPLCLTSSHVSTQSSQKLSSKSSKKSPKMSDAAVPSPSRSSTSLTAAGRVRKSKEQLDILKEYFLRCPWPKSEEYTQLVELTSLPRADVIQWFGDTRYAVKNGHLRWVRGAVRDQILAEIAVQQNGGAGAEASSSSAIPKNDSMRKRKSQLNSASNVPKSVSDSLDMHPLELYYQQTGILQEKDLDVLCRKSKMSYQQVRDWFACKDGETAELQNSSED